MVEVGKVFSSSSFSVGELGVEEGADGWMGMCTINRTFQMSRTNPPMCHRPTFSAPLSASFQDLFLQPYLNHAYYLTYPSKKINKHSYL